jgi:prepilin-type N-terminal cleavage/methylation domain-containing protein
MWAKHKQSAFTIIELLIVIVVIGILAAITVVAFTGVQQKARGSLVISDITQVHKALQSYYVQNGSYPATQAGPIVQGDSANQAYLDANCSMTVAPASNKRTDWVPGLNINLPQSDGNPRGGARNSNESVKRPGCYAYQSDGTTYYLSAWNMLNEPQTTTHYRRLGLRETTTAQPYYFCNHGNIGGNNAGTYDAGEDYYKHSYVLSNINSCNETPPAGA